MEEYRRDLINSICAEKFDRELFKAISTEIINQLNLSDYIKNIVLHTIKQCFLPYFMK